MPPPGDPELRRKYLGAMSRVASTVSVVTTDGPAGWAGLTVTALSSVSADGDHPTLLVCLNMQSPAAGAVRDNGVFCVNILREDQTYIADGFAGRYRNAGGDKFFSGEWQKLTTGAPALLNAAVTFDCRVTASQTIGTHHVFIGAVVDVAAAEDANALLYANRGYGRMVRLDAPGSRITGPPAEAAPGRGTGSVNLRKGLAMLIGAAAAIALAVVADMIWNGRFR